MPRLSQTATVSVKAEKTVKLTSQQTTRLRTDLKTYNALKGQKDVLDVAMKRHRRGMEDILDELGEASLSFDEHRITMVAPVRKKRDDAKLTKFLIKKGVAMAVITEALRVSTTETPQTPYVKVTAPKGSNDEEEEE